MSGKTISEGFKYPFKNWTRLFNFWWVLTIIGVFPVFGYLVEIIEGMLKKDFSGLPKFKGFFKLFGKGFMFLLALSVVNTILIIIYGIILVLLTKIPYGIVLYYLISIVLGIMIAFLMLNYIKTGEFSAIFDVGLTWKIISKDFVETIFTVLKTFVVIVLFMLLSLPIITLIIIIPAMMFVSYYFYADLYNRMA